MNFWMISRLTGRLGSQSVGEFQTGRLTPIELSVNQSANL